jgi:hypothetical protein
VDIKYAKEITEKINKLIKEEKFMMNLPIEIRFTKRDEIWLSPEYQQDSCCFTLQMFRQEKNRALFFKKLEELFATYKGRPHWGKWHSLTCAQLKELYPKWEEWLSLRYSHKQRRGSFERSKKELIKKIIEFLDKNLIRHAHLPMIT